MSCLTKPKCHFSPRWDSITCSKEHKYDHDNNGKNLTCFTLSVLSVYEGYEDCIIKIFTNPRCLLLLYKYDIVYVIYAILQLVVLLVDTLEEYGDK